MRDRRRVVVLGGGISALSAAFELTSRPGWRDEFAEITIYQPGWRLGGKAAGGRNPHSGLRIESTGRHVWFGFYDHAFRLVRRCYAELKRPRQQPLARWEDAFTPHDSVTVYDEHDGQRQLWDLRASRNDKTPGDADAVTSPWDYVARATQSLRSNWKEFDARTVEQLPKERQHLVQWTREWVDHAAEFTAHLDGAVRMTGRPDPLMSTAADILDTLRTAMIDYVKALPNLGAQERQLWIQLDFTLTALRGALRDRLPVADFRAVDDLDFRTWLRTHGGLPATLMSPLLRALYDFLFADDGGEQPPSGLSAGTALSLLCRMAFDFKGALLWSAPAGIADSVFAPLYEILHRRGVRFRFFHRVRNLQLSHDCGTIDRIKIERQATCQREYEPLIDVNGLQCWPNAPRYEFLVEGDELRKRRIDLESVWSDWSPVEVLTLRKGEDFDDILLGVPLGALPHCCAELFAASAVWRDMLQHVRTVPTTVSQLWFHRTNRELGWDPQSILMTGLIPPLETVNDTTASLRWEDWNIKPPPRGAAEVRGVLRETTAPPPPGPSDYPQQQRGRVLEAALRWMKGDSRRLWPRLHGQRKSVHWEYLVDPANSKDEARLEAQHHRANVEPSDRYVQSIAGSSRFRISSSRPWFGNLYVCGDWTRTPLNAGCMEAAVVSGILAAAALTGTELPAELESRTVTRASAFGPWIQHRRS